MQRTISIAVQMYTLRDVAKDDMAGTLRSVADFGYGGVELAGFNGMSVNELKESLNQNRLALVSAHVGFDDLRDNIDTWCENLKTLGAKRVTIPWISGESLDGDQLAKTAAVVNDLQKKLWDAGIELSYHNHDFEFENQRFDRLIDACPELKFELDTYWAEFAGINSVELMKQLGDRLTLIHIKDMMKDAQSHSTPNPNILEGVLDIKSILNQAINQGVEWAIVEMDIPIGNSIDAVHASRENLRKAGY
ncbi:MAG: sugar phosphate isomerase/epimerase [Oscillospiraceae bacterium]|nr:sugar phosphate isomerase/epimerase [Oscillospiraceae bacterium]